MLLEETDDGICIWEQRSLGRVISSLESRIWEKRCGKFAKQLLDKGSNVICVEPNNDMRMIAEKELGKYKNFKSINGTASSTHISSKAVDFVTTAQAFHWFDITEFKTECKRILKENGKAVLIWNIRNMVHSLNQESYDIYKKYCPNFKGFSRGMQENDERIINFFDGSYEVISFDNPLLFTKEKFISRSLSGSYSLR